MKKMELNEILLEEAKKKKEVASVQIQKGTLGSKAKGVLGFVKNHKGGTIGASALVLAGAIAFSTGCSTQKQDKDIDNETTTTIEEVTETTPEITTTTIQTTTPTTTTVEETTTTTAIIETTPVETTVVIETEAPIVVTKPVTQTTVAETTPEITTTTIQTTTAPVTTTAAPQPVVEKAEPIQVEDLNGKISSFKGYLNKAELIANDDMIKNTIRVINSDFIEHDGLNEITSQRHESSLSLLSSYGSVNSLTLSAAYLGDIGKVEEGFYIPSEICSKENRKIIDAFTKLSESYRLTLNSIGAKGVVELTQPEEDQISTSVMQELDKLNIADSTEWEKKYAELYTTKCQEIYEAKQNEITTQRNAKVQAAYKEFFDGVIVLVNSKEYENLTPAEKLVVFTNVSGALVSGMTEDQKNQYMEFHNGIKSSIDEAREDLVIANRNNINQKDALNEIVKTSQVKINQERKDLADIATKLENMYSSNKEYVLR